MFFRLLAIAAATTAVSAATATAFSATAAVAPTPNSPNGCVSFQVSAGTGCAWMCNYCATTLGTTNYYFTDNVCTYETGGCVGNPQVGVVYTCCSG